MASVLVCDLCNKQISDKNYHLVLHAIDHTGVTVDAKDFHIHCYRKLEVAIKAMGKDIANVFKPVDLVSAEAERQENAH